MLENIEKNVGHIANNLSTARIWEAWSESDPLDLIYAFADENDDGFSFHVTKMENSYYSVDYTDENAEIENYIKVYLLEKDNPELYKNVKTLYAYAKFNTPKSELRKFYLEGHIEECQKLLENLI